MSTFDRQDIRTYVKVPDFFCKDFSNNMVIFFADGGNHFTHLGIYEGTILFVDMDKEYKEGHLSCFKNCNGGKPKYKLSEVPLEGYEHLGRVVKTIRKPEE